MNNSWAKHIFDKFINYFETSKNNATIEYFLEDAYIQWRITINEILFEVRLFADKDYEHGGKEDEDIYKDIYNSWNIKKIEVYIDGWEMEEPITAIQSFLILNDAF